jgi:hypothetical protein
VGRERNGTNREREKTKLPAHNEAAQRFMFDFTQRFHKNVSPIEVGVYLDHFNVTGANVILKPVSFEGNMFGADFGTLTMSQDNA